MSPRMGLLMMPLRLVGLKRQTWAVMKKAGFHPNYCLAARVEIRLPRMKGVFHPRQFLMKLLPSKTAWNKLFVSRTPSADEQKYHRDQYGSYLLHIIKRGEVFEGPFDGFVGGFFFVFPGRVQLHGNRSTQAQRNSEIV